MGKAIAVSPIRLAEPWLWGRRAVGPPSILGPKEGRNSKGERSDLFPSSDPGPPLFELHDAGKLATHPLRHVLDADLAIPETFFTGSGFPLENSSSTWWYRSSAHT
jgi:hypothetical protein